MQGLFRVTTTHQTLTGLPSNTAPKIIIGWKRSSENMSLFRETAHSLRRQDMLASPTLSEASTPRSSPGCSSPPLKAWQMHVAGEAGDAFLDCDIGSYTAFEPRDTSNINSCGTLGNNRTCYLSPLSESITPVAPNTAPANRSFLSQRRGICDRYITMSKKSGRSQHRIGSSQGFQERRRHRILKRKRRINTESHSSIPAAMEQRITAADTSLDLQLTIQQTFAVEDSIESECHSQPKKPRILIIATGGTIAGKGNSPSRFAGYQSGVIGVEDIVQQIPELNDVAHIETRQECNIGSPDVTPDILIRLAQSLQADLARPDVDGVVITHGTDTLEESSFFLDITVFSPKPIVVTGSMLPSTSRSADGPKNIFDAVRVAGYEHSRNRGVLVVFNGKMMPARYTIKSDANTIETFDPGHQGCLGQILEDRPIYYYPAARSLAHQHFDISSLRPEDGLPRVGVVYGRIGVDDDEFRMRIDQGKKGIVLAGMGAGCWSHKGKEELSKVVRLVERDGNLEPSIPIVTSFRAARGLVTLEKDIFGVPDWVIRSGTLNPAKSCLLLQLCLALGMPFEDIRLAFAV